VVQHHEILPGLSLSQIKSGHIPPKSNRKVQRTFDKEMYKARHLIENFFCKLRQYRANATRYDKTARNFLAAVHLAAPMIPELSTDPREFGRHVFEIAPLRPS